MKQQQHDDTALYRELRGAFEMSPAQKRRVEQEILRRAAAAKPVTVQTEQNGAPVITMKRKAGGYGSALRMVSLAACLVLVCAGAFFLHRGLTDRPDTLSQQSSVAMEEILTAPAETVTETTVTTVTAATSQAQKTTATVTKETAVLQQTAAVTESAAETQAEAADPAENQTTAPVQITNADQTTTKTTTAKTTTTAKPTTTVTTTAVTTTTAAETEEPEELHPIREVHTPDEADLMMPDQTVRAGETVTVPLRFTKDMGIAGIQLFLKLESPSGAELPKLSAEVSDENEVLLGATLNYDEADNVLAIVFATGRVFPIRGNTALADITLRIPENAAAGTVYKFRWYDEDASNSRVVNYADESLCLSAYFGTITVN